MWKNKNQSLSKFIKWVANIVSVLYIIAIIAIAIYIYYHPDEIETVYYYAWYIGFSILIPGGLNIWRFILWGMEKNKEIRERKKAEFNAKTTDEKFEWLYEKIRRLESELDDLRRD